MLPFKKISHEIAVVTVSKLLDSGLMSSQLFAIAQEVVNESYSEAKKSYELILKEESFDLSIEIEL